MVGSIVPSGQLGKKKKPGEREEEKKHQKTLSKETTCGSSEMNT
jgi:hypothetical protein